MDLKLVNPHHVLAFVGRGAYKTKSGLYIPVHGLGDYSQAIPIYPIKIGEKVTEVTLGERYWVSDGFELREVTNLWEQYKDDKEYEDLLAECQELGATPRTVVCHNRAILCQY